MLHKPKNAKSVLIACQMWASREIWIQLISNNSYEYDLQHYFV